jgi:hypothetical protein
MKKIVSILFLIFSLVGVSLAQKFIASASKTKVAVGETFQISFSLNANGANFKVPALNDFDVYSGPNQSSSMSFGSGGNSQSITLSYIIAAKKEGKFTIGAASVSVNGGSIIQSNTLAIEVVKGSANTQNQGGTNPQNPSSPTTENVGDNLFVKTTVSKTKAYIGEQITITHKVYTRYIMRGFQDIKYPDYNGFWAQDVPNSGQQIQLTNENIDGVNYQVAELKRSYLFAQRSGKIEIAPLDVAVVVRKQSNKKPRDVFEQFFGGGYEDASYNVKSKAITLDIQALPEANKPASFSGAVGEYSFKAQLSKDKIKANDAANLTITLSGKGNLKLVDPVKINFPEDFETYDPKTKENITTGATGVSGSKTFDYLIIPRHEGDYKIDQINFSYFDPEKKEYITLPSPDFNLHVDKGDENSTASASVFNPRSKEDVKVLGNDIRYIKTKNIVLKPQEDYFFSSTLFYACIISPFIAFIGFLFFRKKNIEMNSDFVAVKSRKATKMAKKRLVLAEQHLKSSNKEKFYVEIFSALYGYISDKLNIPVADLNKEYITEKLKSRNVNDTTINQLMTTLSNCEYAQYAPSAASGDLNGIYNNTVELITKIEDEIK